MRARITKRRKAIARPVPANDLTPIRGPDFLERLRSIYGKKVLKVSGAELVEKDRDRY